MGHKGIDWDNQPLGELPDMEIARRVGCNPTTVARVRYRRNIPAYRFQRRIDHIEYGEFRKAQGVIAEKLRREPVLLENYIESISTLLLDSGHLVEDEVVEEIVEMVLRYPVRGR